MTWETQAALIEDGHALLVLAYLQEQHRKGRKLVIPEGLQEAAKARTASVETCMGSRNLRGYKRERKEGVRCWCNVVGAGDRQALSLRSVWQVCYPNFSRMQIRRALWLAMNHPPNPGLTGPEYAALCVDRAPCMKPSKWRNL